MLSLDFWLIWLVLLALGLFVYLYRQKFWLSQALMYVLMGVGLYGLDMWALWDQGRCLFAEDGGWQLLSQQFDACVWQVSVDLSSAVMVAQVLLLSGGGALLLIPILKSKRQDEP